MFGDWLKERRSDRRWTQQDLATHSGVKLSYIKQLEINRRIPGRTILAQFAAVFDMTIDQIMRESGLTIPAPITQLESEGAAAEDLEDLLQIWHTLTPEDRETAIALTRSLAERAKKRAGGVNGHTHPAAG